VATKIKLKEKPDPKTEIYSAYSVHPSRKWKCQGKVYFSNCVNVCV